MRSAVLFLVFNRPDTTKQVFEAIRKAKPPRLYIAADGTRSDRPGEKEKCDEVRRIATTVDWDCEVKTLFREKNLGCKIGVSSGIDWFFENEEEGIILEDDCFPAQSFFRFCDEMLDRYKDDTRVWQISGSMFFPDVFKGSKADYLFTRYGPIWGWASWSRAWRHYDADLTQWKKMSEHCIMKNVYPNEQEKAAKIILGSRLYKGEIDTWDFQWGFAKNFNNALTIIPKHNQIVNIGFNAEATHTISIDKNAPKEFIQLKDDIIHPEFIFENLEYSALYSKTFFPKINYKSKIKNKAKIILDFIYNLFS